MFKKIMVRYFDKPITIGTIRKVMETALSESSLNESAKNNLSNAMLHDPATAQEYYVMKDYVSESNTVNQQWKQFRSTFVVLAAATPTPSTQVTYVDIPVANAALQHCSNQNTTPAACMVPSSLPSLASSPIQSDDESFKEQDVREVANDIAQSLVPVTKSNPTAPRYPMRPGDWNCSCCDYTNFAWRTECKRCGKSKNKRSSYEVAEQPQAKRAKTSHDISKVLRKAKNKEGEDIFFVVSQKSGEVWVKAKHIPAHLL